ncbi:glycosyltransferase family 4 protein [Ramlibacter sp. MMS24-I3-19]|uniref:glycosyltransferase family 4 protein n=1 Tax=Ramlibacter sp. MMS24-I3-19 TaxID=3416606 RepID=UPI003D00010E
MRVLHVAQTAKGGVGSYLDEVVPLQARRYGPDSVHLVLPQEDAALFPGLQAATVHGFPRGSLGRAGSTARAALCAARESRAWAPDVIHLHSTFAGLARPLLRAACGAAKVVYCAHGWAFDREGSAHARAMAAAAEWALSPFCHAIVSISQHDHRRALDIGIASPRCRLVRNGIADLPEDPPLAGHDLWPAGRLRVLFVGRLDRQKGIDVLYRAMAELGGAAFAVIVGQSVVDEGPGAVQPPNVHVTGWLPRARINALYRSADVFVAPSRWEGFSLVTLEAMRASLPVVASRVGGLQELVADGWSGRLVRPGDAGELAEALRALGSEELSRMGARGRERFLQRYDVQRVVQELDGVYRQVLDGGRAMRPMARGS